MYIASRKEIEAEIYTINNYLGQCTWMDFVLCHSSFVKIELFGAIDQTYNNYSDNYEISIIFDQPHFVSSVFSWQLDTSRPFIRLVSDDEAYALNQKYQIEYGNYIFMINAEGFETPPVLIAAKKIGSKILNKPPFPHTQSRISRRGDRPRSPVLK